mgnify:CR=1 FL=1
MDWKECCNKRTAKKIEVDDNLISSLKKTSENRLKSSDELKMNDINACSKVSLAYDSLREILEALSIKNKYKIYNHECYTSFLKEILNESDKGDDFDEIRKVRNGINYYGKDITLEEAKDVIKKIKKLRQSFLFMLK